MGVNNAIAPPGCCRQATTYSRYRLTEKRLVNMRFLVQWYLSNPEWCRCVQDGRYQGERLGAINSQELLA
jgi:hypothetical protein